MSREVKFRAWSKTSKKMLDRVLAGPGDPCSIVWIEEREEWVNFDETCGVIMQFTGLTDKHGKEIYEGDIVKHPPYWHDDREVHVVKDIHMFCGDYGNYGDIETEIEVIGNIYENGDLLK